MIPFRPRKERKAMAAQDADRGEFVNTSAADPPEVTGEYWILYRHTTRRITAKSTKIFAKITMVVIRIFEYFIAGYRVSGGIVTIQASTI
jgi:hypothetical protein